MIDSQCRDLLIEISLTCPKCPNMMSLVQIKYTIHMTYTFSITDYLVIQTNLKLGLFLSIVINRHLLIGTY